MPKEKFQRALHEDVLERVRTDHNLVALVQYCRADPSLSIFLRGPRDLDVYWEGSVVFHVTISSGKLRVGSEHDEPVEDLPTSFDDWDPARLPEYIAWVKDLRAVRVATKTPELRFEAAVIRDNQAAGSSVMVLDRQIAGPGGKDQLDLMRSTSGHPDWPLRSSRSKPTRRWVVRSSSSSKDMWAHSVLSHTSTRKSLARCRSSG